MLREDEIKKTEIKTGKIADEVTTHLVEVSTQLVLVRRRGEFTHRNMFTFYMPRKLVTLPRSVRPI